MAQIKELNKAAKLSPPVKTSLTEGKIDVDLPVNSLVLLEVSR
jgi:hypothetical protein